MTKAQMLAEINRLRTVAGLPVAPAPSVPAQATAAPAWATGVNGAALRAQPVAAPTVAATVALAHIDRVWYDTGERGESKQKNPTIILLSTMRSGGFFRCTLPADVVRAIAHGKVIGADGKPVTF